MRVDVAGSMVIGPTKVIPEPRQYRSGSSLSQHIPAVSTGLANHSPGPGALGLKGSCKGAAFLRD